MIKATAHTPDGPVLILGLSRENVTRLLSDQPILVSTEELGLPPMEILLVGGETELSITAMLAQYMTIRPS